MVLQLITTITIARGTMGMVIPWPFCRGFINVCISEIIKPIVCCKTSWNVVAATWRRLTRLSPGFVPRFLTVCIPCVHVHQTASTFIGVRALVPLVTIEDAPIPFSPFLAVNCTMLNHFSFEDFIAIAFPDLAGDLDIQI